MENIAICCEPGCENAVLEDLLCADHFKLALPYTHQCQRPNCTNDIVGTAICCADHPIKKPPKVVSGLDVEEDEPILYDIGFRNVRLNTNSHVLTIFLKDVDVHTRLLLSNRDDYFTYTFYTTRINLQWNNHAIHTFEMAHILKCLHVWNQISKHEYKITFTDEEAWFGVSNVTIERRTIQQ